MLKQVSPFRLTVVGAAAAGLLLSSCNREPAPATPTEAPIKGEAPARLDAVTPEPPLNRQTLLAALADAASEYASGASLSGSDPLVRRTFDVRLAFGCSGEEESPGVGSRDGLARWSWGPGNKTIRIDLVPADWGATDLITGSAGPAPWEAVEGLWISRPWMRTEGCPPGGAASPSSGPASASPETAGLAAVFEEGGSRLGRRNGRAYTHTIRADADAAVDAPRDGYRLRLQGRIAAFPDGRAIHCRSISPGQRPVCVVAVQLDRVAFQTATGETLSEWRTG